MIVAVDASVAIKWLVREALSESAEGLLGSGHELIAPDVITLETASGLLRAARQGRFDIADVHQGLARLPALLTWRVAMARYESDALAIAARYHCSVYDACYMAVAAIAGATLATGDERQVAACLSMGLRVSRLENGFADLLRQ